MVPILVNGELGLSSQGKPKANLLLLGPPGVGKTEDVQQLFAEAVRAGCAG
jgi:ATP-dependent Clp protease ATP-binding subunit ClpA